MPEDGFRYDLIEGELRKMQPAGFYHGAIGNFINGPLMVYVTEHGFGIVTLAETGFQLASDPDTVLAPDIAFISKANLPNPWPQSGYFPGAPDLAIEVASPGNSTAELDEKVEAFLRYGTKLVWIVRPKRKVVEVHRADGSISLLRHTDTLDGENVVPGFSRPLSRVFL